MTTMSSKWQLDGQQQDDQSITRDWQLISQRIIDG